MKHILNRNIKMAFVAAVATLSFGIVLAGSSSLVYAAVCPGTGAPAPDNDVANCPKPSTTTTPTTPTSTSTVQPSGSGLDDPFKTGECPAGKSIVYIAGTDGPEPKCSDDVPDMCGSPLNRAVEVSFDFGCIGPAYSKELNPIMDMGFAIFRFLSAGVGLLVIGSVIWAGIQYSASRGNPQATGAAIKRITNAIIGLLIYIFMFAILNFIVPGGLFL